MKQHTLYQPKKICILLFHLSVSYFVEVICVANGQPDIDVSHLKRRLVDVFSTSRGPGEPGRAAARDYIYDFLHNLTSAENTNIVLHNLVSSSSSRSVVGAVS